MTISKKLPDQHDYGYEVPPCSRATLLQLANVVHKATGYVGDGPFDVLHLVEVVFPIIYGEYDFIVSDVSDMPDVLGATYPNQHKMVIREDTYNAACQENPFARLTIAHEAAHQLKHEGILPRFARRATRDIPAYRSSEWQANALAGALLMPADKICNLSIDSICRRYCVTKSAASTQRSAIDRELGKGPIPTL